MWLVATMLDSTDVTIHNSWKCVIFCANKRGFPFPKVLLHPWKEILTYVAIENIHFLPYLKSIYDFQFHRTKE